MTVKNYDLKRRDGTKIRVATMVILENGQEIRFTEKMGKREAIKNALYQITKA